MVEVKSKHDRSTRKKNFIEPIMSNNVLRNMHTVLKSLRPIRRLLRVFDSEDCCISEVLPKTNELESILRSLPVSKNTTSGNTDQFFTKEGKDEFIEVFEKRRGFRGKDVNVLQVTILEDVHYLAHMLDPVNYPQNWGTEFMMERLHQHVTKYRQHYNHPDHENTFKKQDVAFVTRIVSDYVSTVRDWKDRREELNKVIKEKFNGKLVDFWKQSRVPSALREFAMRTLCCSPSAMVVDRSFSIQKLIHNKQRNRFKSPKVAKMMFIKWNMKLMKGFTRFNNLEFLASLTECSENAALSDTVPDDEPPPNTQPTIGDIKKRFMYDSGFEDDPEPTSGAAIEEISSWENI